LVTLNVPATNKFKRRLLSSSPHPIKKTRVSKRKTTALPHSSINRKRQTIRRTYPPTPPPLPMFLLQNSDENVNENVNENDESNGWTIVSNIPQKISEFFSFD